MLEKELQVALSAVRAAAHITRKVQHTQISSFGKEDSSPVTFADYAAQGVIISAVKRAFPKDPFVGEEDADKLRRHPKLADAVFELSKDYGVGTKEDLLDAIDQGDCPGGPVGRQWALDPVDGTKGFLRGGQYAICLALIVDSKVQLGVIGCPNLDECGGLFWAVKGSGSWYQPLNNPEAVPQSISFRHLKSTKDAIFCESVEGGHSNLGAQAQIAEDLGITKNPLRMDSQAKYCVLAKGDADIYLRLPVSLTYEEKIWDHASGSLLVTEAGGIVTDMYGRDLDFGQGRTLKNNKGVIASNRKTHPVILAKLASMGK